MARTINGIEVEMGSGNVFADLGLQGSDKLKIKFAIKTLAARARSTRATGQFDVFFGMVAIANNAMNSTI